MGNGGDSELPITGSTKEEADFVLQAELRELREPSAPTVYDSIRHP